MNVLIDTDPGHDDALALLFALGNELMDVKAVTTVAGNAEITDTTRNAGRVLRLAGRDDIPLYRGSNAPLERDLTTANVHGDSGLDGMDTGIEPADSREDAIERIAVAADSGATIITLGPLTNIARALEKYPDRMAGVERIVSMGGAIDDPGNQNRVAEFNMYVDPEAAATVIESDLDTCLVPLDPCNDILVHPDDLPEGCSIQEEIRKLLKPFMERLGQLLDVNGVLVYDAVAAFAAAHPDHTATEEHDIVVETDGAHTRGMLIPEERDYVPLEPTTEVVTNVDKKAFKQKITSCLEVL